MERKKHMNKISKDTFWEMIAQGREACAGNLDALVHWLEDKLAEMGPEAALEFDAIVHAYYGLAYKYGLWNAASIMCNGCTDDGFWDFLGWLIAQGREVYLAALKDPDSLAELLVCKNCWFPDIAYVGDAVYHRITGKDNSGYPDRETFDALKEELKKDITYGDGVGYPHTWSETAAYLPKLCAKYMQPGELEWRIANHNDTWNPTSEEIQMARATEKKGVKI